VDNVETKACATCNVLVPIDLHRRNGGVCFQCACDLDYAEAVIFHRELDAWRPQRPAIVHR
jgi:hypothetical protein